MTMTVRELTAEEAEAAWQLGFEAFGVPSPRPAGPAVVDQPGRTWFGTFAGNVLTGRMIDRAYDSYFGGALVPTCGIAGVTVAAEYRGQGSLTPLFTETLRFALERGAVISTLFPTAPRIYRRFGYELVADFVTVELPTAMLAAVPRPLGSVRGGRRRPTSTLSGPSTTRGRSSRTARSAGAGSPFRRVRRTSWPPSPG